MCVSASSESSTVQSDIAVNGTSFDDIQHSIDSSSINDTIVLNGNYKSTGSPITISKSLKFQGENNATLDGRKVSGIFNIPKYVNLTFNNINFINSKNSVIAIGTTELSNDFNSKLILNNCNFINNSGYEYVTIHTYELEANNCSFMNNKLLNSIQESFAYSSIIHATYCKINNSNFTNNYAYHNGGVILSEYASINNSNFINNLAGQDGGAIYTHTINISNSNFTHNCASRFAGAIYLSIGNIIDCNFINNIANNRGGAIFGYMTNISSSNFENNSALYGGAVYSSQLNITNSIFKNNHEGAILSVVTTIDSKTLYSHIVSLDNSLNAFNFIKINVNSMKAYYSSNSKLKISFFTTDTNKQAKDLDFWIEIKNKKYHYSEFNTADSKGLCNYPLSRLAAGTYTFQIIVVFGEEYYPYSFLTKTVKVTILKANTIVKAPKITNKYKKSKYFKVSIKNKLTNKVVKYVTIKLKIYTGKKYKTYSIKTDKRGIAKFKTNKLKKGKHKVVISSGNTNYKISKISLIRIK